MKLAGIFIVSMICVWTGMMASVRLSNRVNACLAFQNMLVEIKNEIGYLATPSRQILEKLMEDVRYERYQPFLKEYGQASLETAEHLLPAELTKSDRNLILSFFKDLGGSDIKGQLAICSLCESRTEECCRQAESRRNSLSRLYLSLGVFAGIASAIFIL